MSDRSRLHNEWLTKQLQGVEFAAEFLAAAAQDGEPAVLMQALRKVAEARGGMTKISTITGLSREALYRTLSSQGNPELKSLTAILEATGLRLSVVPGCAPKRKSRSSAKTETRRAA